ncbi:hypothetical protein CC78DRAFT_473104, partial [Lojkania enalia]
LIINGKVVGELCQYIRKTDNFDLPLQNVNYTNMRCNSGAASGANTLTHTVLAGSEVGFGVAETFSHPGPQQAYPPRVLGLVSEYDDSGDWTKIYSLVSSPPILSVGAID